jgi:hypothetical protein
MSVQIVSYEKTQIFDRSTRKIEQEFETLEAAEAAIESSEFLTDALAGEMERIYRVETESGESAY